MILSELEVMERVESPMNLLNRLKNLSSKSAHIPSLPCSLRSQNEISSSEVIPNLDDKIAFGTAKSKAMNLMNAAMDELNIRLPEVQRPEKLAAIAADMSRIINSAQIKTENDVRIGQIVVYSPKIVHENHFDVIDARSEE